MRLDVYLHEIPEDEPPPWTEQLLDQAGLILERLDIIMATIEELNAAVERNTSVDDSVLTMLQGVVQQLKDAKAQNDPKAFDAIIAKLDANTQKMADAVTANTPADSGNANPTPPADNSGNAPSV